MESIKWIKLPTNFFESENCLFIEQLPKGDTLLVIWLKILTLAGKQNSDGVFLAPGGRPYTAKLLSTVFRRKESLIKSALDIFEEYGMIRYENGAIILPSWNSIQDVKRSEKKDSYMKDYMRIYRMSDLDQKEDVKAECKVNSNLNSKCDVSSLEEEGEEEKDEREEKEEEGEEREREEIIRARSISYKEFVKKFNKSCPSFPAVKTLSKKRMYAIDRVLETFTLDELQKCFEAAERSVFLKGEKGFVASFDWLIQPENTAKVLEGNFDNPKSENVGSFNSDEFFSAAIASSLKKHMNKEDLDDFNS